MIKINDQLAENSEPTVCKYDITIGASLGTANRVLGGSETLSPICIIINHELLSCRCKSDGVIWVVSERWLNLYVLKANLINLLTSSNMSSFSSSCLSSWRERRCGREGVACGGWSPRKVGVPSTVVTSGFSRPPRSNSWAEIFLSINNWCQQRNSSELFSLVTSTFLLL